MTGIEKQFEPFSINKLPTEILSQFERAVMPDNSVKLIRYKNTVSLKPEIKDTYTGFAGEMHLRITFPKDERQIEAIVFIYRTSPNHYQIVGMTDKGLKSEYAKTVTELGIIIKRYFCKTLFN